MTRKKDSMDQHERPKTTDPPPFNPNAGYTPNPTTVPPPPPINWDWPVPPPPDPYDLPWPWPKQ